MDGAEIVVTIGRTSGPCVDKESALKIRADELELVKDVIACVNDATNNHECWYVTLPGGRVVIPQFKD